MSYYNAIEAQVSKKLSRGFQLQGVFTWAKSMDTSSATVAGDAFGNSISSLDWFDTRLDPCAFRFQRGPDFRPQRYLGCAQPQSHYRVREVAAGRMGTGHNLHSERRCSIHADMGNGKRSGRTL